MIPPPLIMTNKTFDLDNQSDWYNFLIDGKKFDLIEEHKEGLTLSLINSNGNLAIDKKNFTPKHYTFEITPNDIIIKTTEYPDFYARLENNAETLRLLQEYE